MNLHSSFILSTSRCYNIRLTQLINPVLRLVFETAVKERGIETYFETQMSGMGQYSPGTSSPGGCPGSSGGDGTGSALPGGRHEIVAHSGGGRAGSGGRRGLTATPPLPAPGTDTVLSSLGLECICMVTCETTGMRPAATCGIPVPRGAPHFLGLSFVAPKPADRAVPAIRNRPGSSTRRHQCAAPCSRRRSADCPANGKLLGEGAASTGGAHWWQSGSTPPAIVLTNGPGNGATQLNGETTRGSGCAPLRTCWGEEG
jgi:hypothetical protein